MPLLQRVICSGEALSSELARRFFESGFAGGAAQSLRAHGGGGGRHLLAVQTRLDVLDHSARSARSPISSYTCWTAALRRSPIGVAG